MLSTADRIIFFTFPHNGRLCAQFHCDTAGQLNSKTATQQIHRYSKDSETSTQQGQLKFNKASQQETFAATQKDSKLGKQLHRYTAANFCLPYPV